MNILHITTYLQGGAGRITFELAREQQKRGHKVSLATSKTDVAGYCNYPEYLENLRKSEIPLKRVDSFFKRDETSYKNAKAMVCELIESQDPTIIHCHASMPALVALEASASLGRRIPIIQTMHGWGTNKSPEQTKQDVATMNRLAKVVAVSKTSKDQLISKGVDSEKTVTITNFVSEQTTNATAALDIEQKTLSSAAVKRIGCIGSLCQRKNQTLIIEALSLLESETIDPIHLFLIGEGPLDRELQQQADQIKTHHKVTFLGYQQNADRYLPFLDALILPSLAEGTPLSVLEAFRDRVPVICSDIPEHREILMRQENGYLFSSNDAKNLAHTIKTVLNSPETERKRITQKAYQKYQNDHTLDGVCQRYIKLYRSLGRVF